MPVSDVSDPKYQGKDQGSLAYLASHPPIPPPTPTNNAQVHADVRAAHTSDVWAVLVGFRVFNALVLRTFFQSDEFYQSLEPAWQLAFGEQSGAWITWEWHNQLRSSIHPILIAIVYKLTAIFCDLLLPPVLRTKLLLFTPKIAMGLLAAVQDYYIWGLAERVYGLRSSEATAALWLTILSPWQWFVSTRPFANSLETTLMVVALYYWPWEWMKSSTTSANLRQKDGRNLKICLVLAGLACMLRPTNIVLWIPLSLILVSYANQQEFLTFIKDASIYGTIVLLLANGVDRLYYGVWTFPAANFLHFNLNENLAIFYGRNRPDYYFTEGIPLLLTTYLPLAITAIVTTLTGRDSGKLSIGIPVPTSITRALTITALSLPVALSFISHKEVRFIYPILPILLVLLAPDAATLLHPSPSTLKKRLLLFSLVVTNITLAVYLGSIHNSGVIAAPAYLRSQFELHNPAMTTAGATDNLNHTTAAFLMPCHSVPWRSSLVYAEIDAWALTCEPPLGLSAQQKQSYRDEADVFYEDPVGWMRREVGAGEGQRPWPQYLVFFAHLEGHLLKFREEEFESRLGMSRLGIVGYRECWRRWNSAWHDDWRRTGDVIVWCNVAPLESP